jgi:hypothetical protein
MTKNSGSVRNGNQFVQDFKEALEMSVEAATQEVVGHVEQLSTAIGCTRTEAFNVVSSMIDHPGQMISSLHEYTLIPTARDAIERAKCQLKL